MLLQSTLIIIFFSVENRRKFHGTVRFRNKTSLVITGRGNFLCSSSLLKLQTNWWVLCTGVWKYSDSVGYIRTTLRVSIIRIFPTPCILLKDNFEFLRNFNLESEVSTKQKHFELINILAGSQKYRCRDRFCFIRFK